ncbi:c-type cytochrome [Anaerohalosphaeraceae bacterium U12dextr]
MQARTPLKTLRMIGLNCMALATLAAFWAAVGLADSSSPSPQAATSLSIEGLPLGKDYPYRSPLDVAISSKDNLAYVVQHTGQCMDIVSLPSRAIVHSISLDGAPSGLALDEAHNRLYVTYGQNPGHIAIIDTQSQKITETIPAGFAPTAPVVCAGGQTLYLCNRFDNEVAAYDLKTRTIRSRLSVAREPIAAALTPDDALLIVAHHLPAQAAVKNQVAAAVDIIDTAALKAITTIQLPNGSTGVRDVCISPDGQYAYIPHTLARFGVPTTQVDRGWMNTAALSIIDLNKRIWLTTVLLDEADLGAANPWAAACSQDGGWLVVTHAGTHELSIIDRQALHDKISRVAAGQKVSEVSMSLTTIPNDLAFLAGLRRRIRLPGCGPRGVAISGKTVVAADYFSDSLAVVEWTGTGSPSVQSIPFDKQVNLSEIRRGEIAFHNAALCFQQWQSCASCHPDARADALNWDLLNDGIGNPKNSRSMLFSHAVSPVMISGIRPNAQTAVRAGFRFIQFASVPEETAMCVDAYLKALRPLSRKVANGPESEAAVLRGKQLFARAQCSSCHTGDYYTDGKLYDVGLGPDERGIRQFATPPLTEIWRTAPYLYDGRAESIKEVLTTYNRGDTHGRTSDLSDQEIDDLIAYILSL